MRDFGLGSFIFIHVLVKHSVCIKAVTNAVLFGEELPCYSQNEAFSFACLQQQPHTLPEPFLTAAFC